MAIPSRVLAIDGLLARVECFGVTREANLLLLDDDVTVGDYVLLQAGGFATERVDAQRAAEALALMRQVVAEAERD